MVGVFFKLAPLRISSSKADRPSYFDGLVMLPNDGCGGGGGATTPSELPRCGRGGGSGAETKKSAIFTRLILQTKYCKILLNTIRKRVYESIVRCNCCSSQITNKQKSITCNKTINYGTEYTCIREACYSHKNVELDCRIRKTHQLAILNILETGIISIPYMGLFLLLALLLFISVLSCSLILVRRTLLYESSGMFNILVCGLLSSSIQSV